MLEEILDDAPIEPITFKLLVRLVSSSAYITVSYECKKNCSMLRYLYKKANEACTIYYHRNKRKLNWAYNNEAYDAFTRMNYIEADSAEVRALEVLRLARFVAPPTTLERELAREVARKKYLKLAAGKRATKKEKATTEVV